MKRTSKTLLVCALALPLSIAGAYAAKKKPVDPETLPKIECSALNYGKEFLQKYPKAPEACLEGRDNHGKRYAKFIGKVYIADPAFVTVTLLNAKGDPVTTFSIKPNDEKQHVNVDGKDVDFHHMSVGDKLTFWIPEGRMTAGQQPSTKESWTVLPPLK